MPVFHHVAVDGWSVRLRLEGLAAAYGLVLACLGDRSSAAFGVPLTLHEQSETHTIVGCFINTAVICLNTPEQTHRDTYLDRVRASVLDPMEDRAICLGEAMTTHAKRTNGAGFIRGVFNCDDVDITMPDVPGLSRSVVDVDRGTGKFDFMLSMVRGEGGIRAAFDLAGGILPDDVARSLPNRFRAALDWLCQEEDAAIGTFDGVLPDEGRTIITAGIGPVATVEPTTLDSAILAAANATPNALAVLSPKGEVTFDALAKRIRAFAEILATAGIGRDDRVVMALPR